MSIFGNLTNEGLEETTDRLGGFQIRATDIYPATIKAAYAGQSVGGARNVTIVVELPDGEYSETIYVTNKKGENWFLNQNDKSKKVPLPGFTTIDDICLVTTGKSLAEQDSEEKVVKIYDFNERKELPKAVPMLVDLIGQTLFLGIVQPCHGAVTARALSAFEIRFQGFGGGLVAGDVPSFEVAPFQQKMLAHGSPAP